MTDTLKSVVEEELQKAYERGVQDGMKREHALWELAKIGQEIELGISYEEANPPEPYCKRCCKKLGTEAHDVHTCTPKQPEPAECDGGQCGIGGYCKECPKPLVKLKEMLEVQGRNGTWNYDPYFHGMYNGMEVMLAVLEGRDPVFREAPTNWLSKKEWVGLTKEELAEISNFHFHGAFSGREFYEDIETKLKEKNT